MRYIVHTFRLLISLCFKRCRGGSMESLDNGFGNRSFLPSFLSAFFSLSFRFSSFFLTSIGSAFFFLLVGIPKTTGVTEIPRFVDVDRTRFCDRVRFWNVFVSNAGNPNAFTKAILPNLFSSFTGTSKVITIQV